MTNETQCTILHTLRNYNVAQLTVKHCSYKTATTGYLIVWRTCLNVTHPSAVIYNKQMDRQTHQSLYDESDTKKNYCKQPLDQIWWPDYNNAFDIAILQMTFNANWKLLILSTVDRLEKLISTYAETQSWTRVLCVESECVLPLGRSGSVYVFEK